MSLSRTATATAAAALATITAALAAGASLAIASPTATRASPAATAHAAGGWGSGSSPKKTSHASKSATVKTAKTSKGTILVSSSGATLYVFTPDGKNTDTCVKHSGCTSAWPPYSVSGKPTAGSGVKAKLLGTIKVGKVEQVTYAGHPLYLFGSSSGADTSYIGASSFGGTWYGVSPSGAAVK